MTGVAKGAFLEVRYLIRATGVLRGSRSHPRGSAGRGRHRALIQTVGSSSGALAEATATIATTSADDVAAVATVAVAASVDSSPRPFPYMQPTLVPNSSLNLWAC